MYVLVINAGSSSLKYQIIDSETEELVTRGLCEKVGYSDAFVQHWNKNDKRVFEEPMENHLVAVKMVLDVLAETMDVKVSQGEVFNFLASIAQQYGMDPNAFIQAIIRNGQIGSAVQEVGRSKGLLSGMRAVTFKSEGETWT